MRYYLNCSLVNSQQQVILNKIKKDKNEENHQEGSR